MIIGIGVDIVQNSRIIEAIESFGDKFLARIFTPQEEMKNKQINQIAARFASKEAVVKALGTGFSQGINFLEIEILSLPSGQAQVHLSGNARLKAEELAVNNIQLSISHEKDYAVAFVIMESL